MSALHDILQQVLHMPGVVGALTYDAQGAVMASSFPESYDAGELQRVSRLLSEDFLVHQTMEGAKGGLDLRYAGGRVILRPFSRGAILALCTAAANAQLVNLGLIQAIHRLERPEPELAPKAPEGQPRAATAEWVRPGVLEGLKEALLLRIGPIGDLSSPGPTPSGRPIRRQRPRESWGWPPSRPTGVTTSSRGSSLPSAGGRVSRWLWCSWPRILLGRKGPIRSAMAARPNASQSSGYAGCVRSMTSCIA